MRYIPVVTVLLAGAVAACAPQVDRRVYLNTLIGLPETGLIQQVGVPTRSYETGGHKYLAYLQSREQVIGGGGFGFGGFYGAGFWGPGFGWGGDYFPPEIIQRNCETTFDVVGGRVASWQLRGNACG